jgi:hypothetical protein
MRYLWNLVMTLLTIWMNLLKHLLMIVLMIRLTILMTILLNPERAAVVSRDQVRYN